MLTLQHALVGPVSDGEDVRRHLVPPLVDVHLDGGLGVDGEAAVRVHRNAEEPGVGLKADKQLNIVSYRFLNLFSTNAYVYLTQVLNDNEKKNLPFRDFFDPLT